MVGVPAEAVAPAQDAPADWGSPGTARPIATSPTTADLYALHGGQDRLLTVREAANRLRVGIWAIYHLCELGELAHIRIIDSIRIRPADLAAYVAKRRLVARKKRPRASHGASFDEGA